MPFKDRITLKNTHSYDFKSGTEQIEGATDCRLGKPNVKKYMVTEGSASVEQGL